MIAPRNSIPLPHRLQQVVGETQIEYLHHPLFERSDAERQIECLRPVDWNVEPHARERALRHPLLQLSELPPLSPGAEYWLFCRMNFLKYQARLRIEQGDRSTETIRELLEEATAIRNEIVMRNMRLLMGVARTFQTPQVRLDDLVSDGIPVLIRAVELFDCSRNYNFSTYATHAVRNALARKLARHRRWEERFVGFPAEGPPEVIDERGDPWQDEKTAMEQERFLAGVMEGLDSRERSIVIARFGLEEKPPLSFQEIGQMVQLSKERVRQISHKAIQKMQASSAVGEFQEWVER